MLRNPAACRCFGHKFLRSWSSYLQRSVLDPTMHCLKRLGKRVMSGTFEHQANALHICVADSESAH